MRNKKDSSVRSSALPSGKQTLLGIYTPFSLHFSQPKKPEWPFTYFIKARAGTLAIIPLILIFKVILLN